MHQHVSGTNERLVAIRELNGPGPSTFPTAQCPARLASGGHRSPHILHQQLPAGLGFVARHFVCTMLRRQLAAICSQHAANILLQSYQAKQRDPSVVRVRIILSRIRDNRSYSSKLLGKWMPAAIGTVEITAVSSVQSPVADPTASSIDSTAIPECKPNHE